MASSAAVPPDAYREILRAARHLTHSEQDARDLVQDAIVIALARGFDDWSTQARRAWIRGVIHRRAAFVARGGSRRRSREAHAASVPVADVGRWAWQAEFLASLPPSLRAVATLASADLCAAEIRWLLGLTDTALRQRLCALRRAVRAQPEPPTHGAPEPASWLGQRRKHLLAGLRQQHGRVLATHDPDGHAIFLRVGPHRTGRPGNPSANEPPMSKPNLKISGIAVVFMVQDLERTHRFYADALGIELAKNEGHLLGMLPGGTELVFFEGEAVRGTSPQIVFGLDEGGIDTAVEALVARGVQVLTPVTEAPGGWSVEFHDPDEHPLAFFQAEALPRRR
jgi:glyoxylase I family protein